ncbi:MAG: CBS domain-containing protein [Alphaproteobacteria bacterium]|nr:CBS domain-containing protein [Alphaproteobacteria bacterium]
MNAGDIMTRQVVTTTPDATIAAAARLMLQNRISGLPVVDGGGNVVGVVTEGDLLRRAETGTERRHPRWVELLIGPGRLADEYVGTHARKVAEVMTDDVTCVAPQTPLSNVVSLMEKRHVKRLPVVEGKRLVGIVSRANLVRALVNTLVDQGPKQAASDAEIRDRLLAEVKRQPWGPRYSIEVEVTDGVVNLYGSIMDERERNALIVLAENLDGVKAVQDHLAWVEPVSGFVIPAN